jgi:hypothetical protein
MRGNECRIAVLLVCVLLVITQAVPAVWSAEWVNLVGTVQMTEVGIVIETWEGDYIVVGKDLSAMIGSLVEVTGVAEENEVGWTIEVQSVAEAER